MSNMKSVTQNYNPNLLSEHTALLQYTFGVTVKNQKLS